MEQVEIQGDDLEEVEDKQFAAQEEVEVGKSHVIRARNSARSARKKKFICLAIGKWPLLLFSYIISSTGLANISNSFDHYCNYCSCTRRTFFT